MKRFQREVEIVEGLDHPNVMPVVGKGNRSADGVPFFVMPRAADGSLKTAIENGRTRRELDGRRLPRRPRGRSPRARAGRAAPRPEAEQRPNLRRRPARLRLRHCQADRRRLHDSHAHRAGARHVALHGPEQSADAKRTGPPADVYALGKILAHMLTGREPTPLVVDLTDVPEKFGWFIDKCCRDDPAERFPDAGVALDRFEQLLQTPEVELPPVERGIQLAHEAGQAIDEDDEAEAIEALDAHLRAYAGEEALYRRVVPRIPTAVIRRWAAGQPHSFRELMRTYDSHVGANGELPFDYCDTAADFLQLVFGVTTDLTVHRLIIARLLEVGVSHNRWHVRNVTVDLLSSLKSTSEVAAAVEVIDDHQRAASWVAEQALKRPLRAPIAEALRRAAASPEAVGW